VSSRRPRTKGHVMQASTTKFITTAALAAALIATLAGCTAQPDTTPAPKPSVSAEPAAPVVVEPAPEPVTPVEVTPELASQIASGLSVEEYAAATAEVDIAGKSSASAKIEELSSRFGKPVSIVAIVACGIDQTPAYGIAGELSGNMPGCVTDKSEVAEILGNRIARSDIPATGHLVHSRGSQGAGKNHESLDQGHPVPATRICPA